MHGPCVKISKKFSTGIDYYYCPRCRPSDKETPRTARGSGIMVASTQLPCIQTSKLLEVSDEILILILAFVRCQKSLCRVSSTCKRLWSVAQDPYLVRMCRPADCHLGTSVYATMVWHERLTYRHNCFWHFFFSPYLLSRSLSVHVVEIRYTQPRCIPSTALGLAYSTETTTEQLVRAELCGRNCGPRDD